MIDKIGDNLQAAKVEAVEMRILKGPRKRKQRSDENVTESKQPSQYIQDWKEGAAGYNGWHGGDVTFKGTIKKDPKAASQLRVEITGDDVCALFNALLERTAEEEQRLRKAMRKILEDTNGFEIHHNHPLIRNVRVTAEKALLIDGPISMPGRRRKPKKSKNPNWNPLRPT